MRHPFAGIIGRSAASGQKLSRRQALMVAAAGAGVIATQGTLFADQNQAVEDREKQVDEEHRNEEQVDPANYALYLIEPKARRGYRSEPGGINGSYLKGLPNSEKLKDVGGFLTWTTAEAAKRIAADDDIAAVHPITPVDKIAPTKFPVGARVLTVTLAPNGWPSKSADTSFLSAGKVLAQWKENEELQTLGADFKADDKGSMVYVAAKEGNLSAVMKVLLEHPQVFAVYATGAGPSVPSTTAAEEEGAGLPDAVLPPAKATKAIDEAGATTFALGEEGGPLRLEATKAIGEE